MLLHFRMPRLEWFRLLGEYWDVCDTIARWRPELRRILIAASRVELDAMMEPSERDALSLLPDRITVYRGCYVNNQAGLSWTLNKDVAARFPSMFRYRQRGQAWLRTGTVRRDRVVLKLGRGEDEIIAPRVHNITAEPLDVLPLS